MCANPFWTNIPRYTTKPQTPRFSSHTSLFWTLPEQIPILYPHMGGNPSWTNVPRNTTKPQTPRFSSLISLFWILPEQISILYPTYTSTLNQCPKTHHKTSDPKIFISHIPVLNSILYPTCVPIYFEPMSQDTPQNLRPKIFISHIPVLNFAGTNLHIIPHICANPSWTNVPRYTTKSQTPRFSSHTSLFWILPEQIPILYPIWVATHLEPISQATPQNLRHQDFHLTHPCFELCRNRSPYYTPHVCQFILNQCPKTHHKTSDPRFSSHTSLFWTLPEQISILYPIYMPTHPEPMFQDRPQNLRPQDFHLTHPCFELCRNKSPYYTPHVCQPILKKYPKKHHKTSDPRFSSHTCLFWTLPEQISILYPTCRPTHPEPMFQGRPQNLRPQDFHLTHACFELCRNRSPYYTPHVCQPILNQYPKINHKTSAPKIFISRIPVLNLARTDIGFELRGAPIDPVTLRGHNRSGEKCEKETKVMHIFD